MPVNRIERIVLIDAIRGLAILGILLLHHIEHFDFYKKPLFNPSWLTLVDKWIWEHMFLLFSGKAFALFSLLFGFSYWIIYANAKNREESYFYRHIWRMLLLAGLGCLHLVFFRGDILIIYALLGLFLIFTRYMNNLTLLMFSILLLLNPFYIYALFTHWFAPEIFDFRIDPEKASIGNILINGSFWDVVKMNFSSGVQATITWSWNVGRFSTISGLFLLGVYFAKTQSLTQRSLAFWYKLFIACAVGMLLVDLSHDAYVMTIDEQLAKKIFVSITNTYEKLAITLGMLCVIVILWRHNNGKLWIANLASFGRMGLTNYLLMSVIGATLYYGWGFGLWQYCGTTISLLIGILCFGIQMRFSSYWLSRHAQGPLEWLWRKGTYIDKRGR